MLARKTDAEAGFPPVSTISSFNASMLDLLIASMGLSFDKRIGRLGVSLSESGGVGSKDEEKWSSSTVFFFDRWWFCI